MTNPDVAEVAGFRGWECPDAPSDRAVYLGDGVWWQLTNAQLSRGLGRGLPQRIRPVRQYLNTPDGER
jgi:hypothetical protein